MATGRNKKDYPAGSLKSGLKDPLYRHIETRKIVRASEWGLQLHHNLARRLQLLSVSESWRGIAFSPFYIKLNFH